MVIVWLKAAKLDLKNYRNNSKIINKEKVQEYIFDLVSSVDILETFPKSGKLFCLINNIELRQLVFKMHRIFYYIKDNKVYILAVVHTSRNVDNVIEYLNNLME